ncbi:MAG TPA: DegV family protein [Bacillota bacterium]|nr:DegV family protein [Bacillota bacterium]
MNKIAVVTDSCSDLTEVEIGGLDIHVLPLKVIYPDRIYTDRVDITPEEIYNNLAHQVPKTSLPSPGEVSDLFFGLREQGYTGIVSIHISSGLSGTVEMVRQVADSFPDMEITVLDSLSLSMGQGFAVLEAARMAKQGGSLQEVVAQARQVIDSMNVYFVVGTLEYLIKGGRIGLVSGTIGELLQLKPVISINSEGKYYTVEKVRGRKKSLQRAYEIVREKLESAVGKVAVYHCNAPEEAEEMVARLRATPGVKEVLMGQVGPVISVHCGPGLLGLVMY